MSTLLFSLILPLAGSLTFSAALSAATYYADPVYGNINNSGSADQPWSSLDRVLAGNRLQAGDQIFLRRGYHGEITVRGANSSPITIEADAGHTPVIRSLTFSGASYWVFKGLTITSKAPPIGAVPPGGAWTGQGAHFSEDSSFNTLENCYLYSSQSTAGWSKTDWNSRLRDHIKIEGPDNIIRGNNIFNGGGMGCLWNAHRSYIGYNVVENFAGDGLGLKGSRSTVEHNLIMNAHKVSSNHNDLCQGYGHHMIFRYNELRAYTNVNDPFVDRDVQGLCGFDGDLYDWVIEGNLVRVDNMFGIWFNAPQRFLVTGNKVVRCTTPVNGRPSIAMKQGKNGGAARNNTVTYNEAEVYRCSPENNVGQSMGIFQNNLVSNTYTPPFDITAPTAPENLRGVVINGYGVDLQWSASTDNLKVTGYEIMLNGSVVGKIRVGTGFMHLGNNIAGTYTVRAFDYNGNTSAPSLPFSAVLRAPTAVGTVSIGRGSQPLSVVFNGSASSDPDGVITSYAWSFGDGTTGTGSVVTHIYSDEGSFTPMLTVRDNDGVTATATLNTIIVEPSSVPGLAVNFQTNAAPVSGYPAYWADAGQIFGTRTFPGGISTMQFGWNKNHTDVTRVRTGNGDARLNTLCQFHTVSSWEIAVPNGVYDVTVSVGDQAYSSGNVINIEKGNVANKDSFSVWPNGISLGTGQFAKKTVRVEVVDGRITVDNGGSADKSTKINYIIITPVAPAPQSG